MKSELSIVCEDILLAMFVGKRIYLPNSHENANLLVKYLRNLLLQIEVPLLKNP